MVFTETRPESESEFEYNPHQERAQMLNDLDAAIRAFVYKQGDDEELEEGVDGILEILIGKYGKNPENKGRLTEKISDHLRTIREYVKQGISESNIGEDIDTAIEDIEAWSK